MKQPPILEHLHYIAKRTFKGHALFISLSAISDEHLPDKIIAPVRAYEQMESCIRYVLDNKDVVLFFNNNKAHHLMLLALKIKAIIGTPLYEKIVSVYDLKTDYARLHNRIYHLVLAPETNRFHTLAVMQKIPHKPFMFQELKRALNHLEGTSLTHLIRKQPVVSFSAEGASETLFTTWFVDMSDIRRILIPDVDILENPFFYGMLRESVAEKVFQKIVTFSDWIGGLNVSVSLFRGSLMKQWLSTHTAEQCRQIVFDFAFEDVIANASDYRQIRKILSDKGYRFVIRMNNPSGYLNISALNADYVKVPVNKVEKVLGLKINPADIIVTGIQNKNSCNELIKNGFLQFQVSGVSFGVMP